MLLSLTNKQVFFSTYALAFTHSPCCTAGFAGSDEKVQYLKSLGFDEAINYKTMGSLKETLEKTCPKGIDMFFDNVSPYYTTATCLFISACTCGCLKVS